MPAVLLINYNDRGDDMFSSAPDIEKLEKENNLPEIVKCLKHRKSEVRLKAFNALFKKSKNDSALTEQLKELINDKSPEVRTNAILTFAQAGDEKIFDNVKSIITGGSETDKIDALRVISEHGRTENPSILNIVALALKDKKEIIRKKAVIAMGDICSRHFIQHIGEAMHDKDAEIRLEAVNALARIGGDEIVDHLIAALMDNNHSVAKAAYNTLTDIGSPKAVKALNDEEYILLMNNINGLIDNRIKAVKHIGDNQVEDAYPLLLKALTDEYKVVRIEALKSIRHFPGQQAGMAVHKLLKDEYADVRAEAVKTIKKFPTEESLKALEELFNDSNQHVKETARTVYDELKGTVK